MRLIKNCLLGGFLAIGLASSCTDLELENTESVISEGFTGLLDPSSTVDDLYNRLAGLYGNQAEFFAMQEVTTDAALIPTRGTDWGDNGRWRKLHTHEWGLGENDIVNPFTNYNTNQLLASQVIDPNSSPTDLNIAEASFIRAYVMWIILDNYGQVPFRDVALPSSAIPEVLSGQAAVDFIIADLDAAIAGLPATAAGSGDANSRASKAAARFLKAKVLLNKHIYVNQLSGSAGTPDPADMTQVVSLVDAITGDGYGIESGYFNIFRQAADNETIWWLPASTGNRIFNGLHYNSTGLGGGGWNGFSTLAEYYDLFEGDMDNNRLDVDGNPIDGQEERRGGVPPQGTPFSGAPETSDNGGFEDGSNVGLGFLVGQQYALDGTPLQDRGGAPLTFKRDFLDGGGAPNLINNDETTGIRVQKYGARYNGGFTNHEIIFRYSDAHLMKAEATLRGGGDATALVNELRTIRNATPLGTVTEDDLLDERGRELFMEAWRRNDMIRFGAYTREWEFKAASSVGNNTYNLFPIPPAQLLSNPNLVQNPGY